MVALTEIGFCEDGGVERWEGGERAARVRAQGKGKMPSSWMDADAALRRN